MIQRLRKSWQAYYAGTDLFPEIHIVPVRDVAKHTHDSRCWCGPFEDPDAPDTWKHNSGDGRENYEQGIRKPH